MTVSGTCMLSYQNAKLLDVFRLGCHPSVNIQRFKMKKQKRFKEPPKAKANEAFAEKIQKLMMEKHAASAANAKVEPNPDEFLEELPKDTVWLADEYKPRQFFFSEAIAMHREYCAPEMFDCSSAIVTLEAMLDFRTKKKTKFNKGAKSTVLLPHYFEDDTDSRIVAICKSTEEKNLALEMGAVYAGGAETIKALIKGDIKSYEYDYLITTIEMLADLSKARKVIKDEFPNQRNGTVGTDLVALIERFKFGKLYETQNYPLDPTRGKVVCKLGNLEMSEKQLHENMMCYIRDLEAFKKCSGDFVLTAAINLDPSTSEKFYIYPKEFTLPSLIIDKKPTKKVAMKDNDTLVLEQTNKENIAPKEL